MLSKIIHAQNCCSQLNKQNTAVAFICKKYRIFTPDQILGKQNYGIVMQSSNNGIFMAMGFYFYPKQEEQEIMLM